MTTPFALDLGAVRFMPFERSHGCIRVLDDACTDSTAALDSLPGPQSVANWPRVHTAFRQAGVFVVETSTAAFDATLRFIPERPHLGDYEIHDRLTGRLERGRTITVRVVPSNDNDGMVSMLAPFATRYAVVTAGSQSPHTRLIWLVGLKAFRTLEEGADSLTPEARPSAFKRKCASMASLFKTAQPAPSKVFRPRNIPR